MKLIGIAIIGFFLLFAGAQALMSFSDKNSSVSTETPAPAAEASTSAASANELSMTKQAYDKAMANASDEEKKELKAKMQELTNTLLVTGVFAEMSGDEKKAVSNYKQAAEFGNANAQHKLGVAYCEGKGGLQESTQDCIKYLEMAAKQGQEEAEYRLFVVLYNQGKKAEAMSWGEISAKRGNAEYQDNFATALYNEAETAPALKKALHWAQLSEKQGNEHAKQLVLDINDLLKTLE